jgi:hypothetical protein
MYPCPDCILELFLLIRREHIEVPQFLLFQHFFFFSSALSRGCFSSPRDGPRCSLTATAFNPQRPQPATPREMTKFHTDDYIQFLRTVTPENMNEMNRFLGRCAFYSRMTSPIVLN